MLSEQQRQVLTVIGMTNKGIHTPQSVAHVVGYTYGQPGITWQAITRTAASLVRRGLITRHGQGTKQTSYDITPAGQQELEAQDATNGQLAAPDK